MSFLLHWSTYFFSTAAQAFKLCFLIASAFEPGDKNERFPVLDGPAVEFQEVTDIDLGEWVILEAVPGDNAEAEIMFAPSDEGVVEGLVSGLLDFVPLLEVVEVLAQEGVDFDVALVDPLQELRPVMMRELEFVRHAVPELTLEQKRNIWTVAEASLKRAADLAAKRDQPEFVQVVGVLLDPPDIHESLRLAIATELRKSLPTNRFERFASMSEFRVSQQKRAAILAIVSRMDGELYLSQSQRDQLINEITSKWDSRWSNRGSMFHFDDGTSCIPEAVLKSCLNEAQQTAWKSLQGRSEFQETFAIDVEEDDGWWSQASPSEESPVEPELSDEASN